MPWLVRVLTVAVAAALCSATTTREQAGRQAVSEHRPRGQPGPGLAEAEAEVQRATLALHAARTRLAAIRRGADEQVDAASTEATAPQPHPFTQEGLGMPRHQMGLALFDQAVCQSTN